MLSWIPKFILGRIMELSAIGGSQFKVRIGHLRHSQKETLGGSQQTLFWIAPIAGVAVAGVVHRQVFSVPDAK